MNDPSVVICKEENDDKTTKTTFLTKDKRRVDFVEESCIMPYIEATEVAQKYKFLSEDKYTVKHLSLKEIVLSNRKNIKV